MIPPNMPPPGAAAGGGPTPMPPSPGASSTPMPPPGGPSDVDQVLLQRFQSLTPQEHDALDSVSPQAADVFMKLVPELKPVIQMVLDAQGGSEGTEGEGDEPDHGADDGVAEADEPEAPGGAPFPPQRPQTKLGQV